MKTLELHQMEQIEGGWRWGGCVAGMGLALYSNSVEVAGLLFGPAAGVAVLVGGCVAGGLML